jgi:lipopolysaccharide export system protein LptC
MQKKILIFSGFIILVLVIILYYWVGVQRQQQPDLLPQSLPKSIEGMSTDTALTPSLPAITVKDVTLRETDKKKGYELVITAKESKFHYVSDVVECYNVMCKILRNGTQVASLYSHKSLVDRLGKFVLCSGVVKGFFKEVTFNGSDICYNFSTQVVFSDKTITYTHPLFTLSANKSKVDINAQKIELCNGVRSEFLYGSASHKRGQ